MGIYINRGKAAYEMAVNSQIFVDKSEMLLHLNTLVNTNQRYVCVSRPRRFGKTMATDMIGAYYDREADSRSMFEGLKLSKADNPSEKPWDIYLGKFDVIRVVMTEFLGKSKDMPELLDRLQQRVCRDIIKKYPDTDFFDDHDLMMTMEDTYQDTDTQFIVLIDEWDAVFREYKEDTKGQKQYLDFLRDWLKDKTYIALAYMTGILPVKKYGKHSALNMFTEYSMMFPRQMARFTGFTEEEVKKECDRFGRDYEKIKAWYDGYEVSGAIKADQDCIELYKNGGSPEVERYSLYSPLSVVEAVSTGIIRNYWNKTETYEALAEYIRMDYDGLKESVAILMDGGDVLIDTSTYQNDMTTFTCRDDILSLLIHLGYLGYRPRANEDGSISQSGDVFIPNREILDEFKTSTKSNEWTATFKAFELSQKLLQATWDIDADKVAELLEIAHDRADNKTYNDESALSYAVRYAYYVAQKYYTEIPELDSGRGYADIAYIPSPKYPDKPALLVELKYDKEATTAIDQIKRQRYPDRLEHYKGNLILVGINYDKEIKNDKPEYKHHSCVIERA